MNPPIPHRIGCSVAAHRGRAVAALLCAMVVIALLVSACSGPRVRPPSAPVATDASAANAVLMRAISLIGTPYRWGGNTPEGGFDCSGLVNYVFHDVLDLQLPRTSRELAAWQGARIAREQLGAADLVFFGSGGEVTHVGIYVGDGRFIHAPRTGGTVRLEQLDTRYWNARYSGARRLLSP